MSIIANWTISTVDEEGNLIKYDAGDEIEGAILSEEDKMHLLNTGAAFLQVEKEEKKNVVPEPSKIEVDEDLLQDFKEAYELEELKLEASNVGLSFAKNISFKNLVKLIVENGKVEEFFEEEE